MRRRSRLGGKPIKARRRKAATLSRPSAPKVSGRHKTSRTNADMKIALLERERDEALEQKTALSEVLRLISNSPSTVRAVLETVAEHAARICEAQFVDIFLVENNELRNVAWFGELKRTLTIPLGRSTVGGRSVFDMRPVHVYDLQNAGDEFPRGREIALRDGHRTILGVPLIREGRALGTILVRRTEVRPFEQKHIDLVTNFASQAVIAIENTRLLNELRQRTDDLTESLEQQTATSEVLRVISSSPGELEPVFQAMLENATQICEAKFGVMFYYRDGAFHAAAQLNVPIAFSEFIQRRGSYQPNTGSTFEQLIRTKQVIHLTDAAAGGLYPSNNAVKLGGARSFVAVPMLKENELVGAIAVYRQEVRPFTDKQIELVQNFAAQAVIAIENTRLLNELRELLEQQTATSDVLRVISTSPGELEPVFQTMLQNAVRICDAKFGNLWVREGDKFRIAAIYGGSQEYRDYLFAEPLVSPDPRGAMGRVTDTGKVVQIDDISTAPTYSMRNRIAIIEIAKARTFIAVPMLKEAEVVGVITIYRQEVRPFTGKQIELVENFAAQAVIAIENTRLLNELHQRTDDLTESLEQQTATSEVLRVISSSPGELEPVFQAMLENATRICEAKFATLWLAETEGLRAVALYNAPPAFAEARRQSLVPPGQNTAVSRVITSKEVERVEDIAADPAYAQRDPLRVALVELVGARTLVVVPMLKEDELVGAISIYRQEVRPFTHKQVELLQNFAAQAVIAIENTRLLNELRKSLQQQTATADVLKVISSSPGELEPVFQAMLENATRICEAKFGTLFLLDGDVFRFAAEVGTPPALAEYNRRREALVPTPGGFLERVMHTKQVSHSADAAVEPAPGASARLGGARSTVCVPMLKDDQLVGVIIIYRQEVRPFTDKQVELVQNFAAQAVIAIENTRLLSELRQSLQQQTATADVLKVISRSTFDLQTVLDALVKSAAQLCDADLGCILRPQGSHFEFAANYRMPQAFVDLVTAIPIESGHGTLAGRVLLSGHTVHLPDALADSEYTFHSAQKAVPLRSGLGVPLLRQTIPIGVLILWRSQVRPFTNSQIALVTTFADQAVIAIENVRLFEAEQQRTRELSEALEQQTATSEVLRVISSSPGDLEPVFQAMLENATQICHAQFGTLNFMRAVPFALLRYTIHHPNTHSGLARSCTPIQKAASPMLLGLCRSRTSTTFETVNPTWREIRLSPSLQT